MEIGEDVELLEDGTEVSKRRRGSNGWSAGDQHVEAFLKNIRGGAEITVVSACCFCGERLSEDPIPLSVSRELSAEHRKKKHPEVTPRDIQGMRDELERQRKAEKRDRERERE